MAENEIWLLESVSCGIGCCVTWLICLDFSKEYSALASQASQVMHSFRISGNANPGTENLAPELFNPYLTNVENRVSS